MYMVMLIWLILLILMNCSFVIANTYNIITSSTSTAMSGGMETLVIVGIVGNVLSTVGVVLVNKYLWVIGFQYMV
jgi:hypothetical protein